jgi:hypothetical protein
VISQEGDLISITGYGDSSPLDFLRVSAPPRWFCFPMTAIPVIAAIEHHAQPVTAVTARLWAFPLHCLLGGLL